jgi:hypothetical protein
MQSLALYRNGEGIDLGHLRVMDEFQDIMKPAHNR